jgi:hypothetical protein
MFKFIAVILSTPTLALVQPTATATADVCGLKSTEIVGYVIDEHENLVPFVWVQVTIGLTSLGQDPTLRTDFDVMTDADGFYSCVYASKPFDDALTVRTSIPGQVGGTPGKGMFEYGDAVCNVSYTMDTID